jgi:hypothetical protein
MTVSGKEKEVMRMNMPVNTSDNKLCINQIPPLNN